MTDLIICVILIVLISTAIIYLAKQKKNGAHCPGCSSGACSCCNKAKKQ